MAHLEKTDGVLHQGAVIYGVDWGVEDSPLSIILSSECDILNDKASFLIVAMLLPAKETLTQSKEYINKASGAKDDLLAAKAWKSLCDFLEGYIYNKGITRYYFIDPRDAIDAPYLLVDFQHITSIPIDSAKELEIVAQLPSPYKEQMVVQFASYTARIPVERDPDISPITEFLASPLKKKE